MSERLGAQINRFLTIGLIISGLTGFFGTTHLVDAGSPIATPPPTEKKTPPPPNNDLPIEAPVEKPIPPVDELYVAPPSSEPVIETQEPNQQPGQNPTQDHKARRGNGNRSEKTIVNEITSTLTISPSDVITPTISFGAGLTGNHRFSSSSPTP